MSGTQRRYASRQPILMNRSASAPAAEGQTIVGYAAVFYRAEDPSTVYPMLDDLEERILPGAFDNALKRDDPVARFNHSNTHILGRKSSGTLRLSADSIGLRYEIDVPNTTVGNDLLELMRRGDVKGSSFAFTPDGDHMRSETRNGKTFYITEIRDCHLYDVGPVTTPAYEGTSAGIQGGETQGNRGSVISAYIEKMIADSDAKLAAILGKSDPKPAPKRDIVGAVRDLSRINAVLSGRHIHKQFPAGVLLGLDQELDNHFDPLGGDFGDDF